MIRERQELDRVVNGWLRHHPGVTILDYRVTQSSDDAFHCITIILFFHDPKYAFSQNP